MRQKGEFRVANDIKTSKDAMTRKSRLAIVFIGLLINAGYTSPTRAQTTNLPPADLYNIITLQDENASISTAACTSSACWSLAYGSE
ncbi:hypothetical protein GFGA_2d0005 (plasmid) [Gluconobacter frateurii NBRC 103465]|nr:hypothetical protein GFGA_2d0005 [Gluconobacter frateurii NBRC 103465]